MTSVLRAARVAIEDRLKPTTLELASGQLVALIGPNGGGKTSLLRALAGIEGLGELSIGEQNLRSVPTPRRPNLLTFLPASRDLAWPISARHVIALGMPQSDPGRVDELIDLLELDPLRDRPVDRLSTGERARVLFARALASRPQLLLLDEPLSNLDPYWVLRFLHILRGEAERGAATLVSLHDIDRLTQFDRAILVDQGEVRADLPPKEMLRDPALQEAFRIERTEAGWRIRR